MKKLLQLGFYLVLILTACHTPTKTHHHKSHHQSTIVKEASPALMHLVFFKTRPDLTSGEDADLLAKLMSLSTIEGVMYLRVGKPAATGDPRLHSDYQYVLQMGFASEKELASYQTNQQHIQAREATKKYLAAPPVVYDYWLLGN